MSATWQNLPYHLKQDVVGLLDFESRCALQTCSKQDDYIVRSAPLTIHCFQICLDHVYPETLGISVQFEKNSARKHKKQNFEATCATFVRVFTKKNIFTTRFQIELTNMYAVESNKPYELWSKLLESEFQINCEQFLVLRKFSRALLNQDFVVWRFLQRVNTKHLKRIEIEPRISENELVKIIESEQFKKSKEIKITMQHNEEGIERIERILRAKNIIGIVEELKANEAWQFIQRFEYHPLYHFALTVNKEMDITSILRRFGVLYIDSDIQPKRRAQSTLNFRRRENCVDLCFYAPFSHMRMTSLGHRRIL